MPAQVAPGRTRLPRRLVGSRVSTRNNGPRYLVQCSHCGKQFRRRDTKLAMHNAMHKMKGNPYSTCAGRSGFIVRWLP